MVKEQDPNNENRFDQTKKAVDERDQFLREHPEMLAFQEEINEVLRKAGNNANRMTQLDILLREKANELVNLLDQLKTTAESELGIEPAQTEPADEEKPADTESTTPNDNDINKIPESAHPPNNPEQPGLILGPADAWPRKAQSQSHQSNNNNETGPDPESLDDRHESPDKDPD